MDPEQPRLWNIWWTLTVISATFTAIVLLLEAFGFFGDLGLVLSVFGLLLTLVFGLGASTRSSITELRGDLVPRLDGLRSSILGVGAALEGLDGRLEGLDGRLEGIDGRLERLDAKVDGTNDRLERIITILDERLPRPAAS
jgi:hypothetical protein